MVHRKVTHFYSQKKNYLKKKLPQKYFKLLYSQHGSGEGSEEQEMSGSVLPALTQAHLLQKSHKSISLLSMSTNDPSNAVVKQHFMTKFCGFFF